jgi:hypothetical protein
MVSHWSWYTPTCSNLFFLSRFITAVVWLLYLLNICRKYWLFSHLCLSWLSNPNTLLSFFPLLDCCSKIVCWQTFFRTFLLNTSSFQTSWSNQLSCKDSELLEFFAFVVHACASRVDFIFSFVEHACFKDSPLLIMLLLPGHCSFLWVESECKAQEHSFTFCDFDLS